MWCSDRRGVILMLAALAGCGFQPLYAPGGPAAGIAGRVAVDVIEGTPGFAMRERLVARLGPASAPTHRLTVSLALSEAGVAITSQDVTSRFEVTGIARYALVPIGGGEAVLGGTVDAATGYSAPSSSTSASQAFAILSARRDAERRIAETLADRIAQRLAVDADLWAP